MPFRYSVSVSSWDFFRMACASGMAELRVLLDWVHGTVLNQDHYINGDVPRCGHLESTVDKFRTPGAAFNTRILVDPNDPAGVAAVNALQVQLAVTASAARPLRR